MLFTISIDIGKCALVVFSGRDAGNHAANKSGVVLTLYGSVDGEIVKQFAII